jgi:hypothetical protein
MREPLPAREVERPVVVPLGWMGAEVEGGHEGGRVGLRAGVARGVELCVALPLSWGRGDALTVGSLGELRISLWRSERPGWSVALAARGEGVVSGPLSGSILGGDVEALGGGLERAGSWSPSATATVGAYLQAGILWLGPTGTVSWAEGLEAKAGGRATLQWSRGLSTGAAVTWAWPEEALRATGTVEVRW